ncbi:unnamed protein product [[Candida] boidinii]|nr:unnamed protein product [[Candida] boidinii]
MTGLYDINQFNEIKKLLTKLKFLNDKIFDEFDEIKRLNLLLKLNNNNNLNNNNSNNSEFEIFNSISNSNKLILKIDNLFKSIIDSISKNYDEINDNFINHLESLIDQFNISYKDYSNLINELIEFFQNLTNENNENKIIINKFENYKIINLELTKLYDNFKLNLNNYKLKNSKLNKIRNDNNDNEELINDNNNNKRKPKAVRFKANLIEPGNVMKRYRDNPNEIDNSYKDSLFQTTNSYSDQQGSEGSEEEEQSKNSSPNNLNNKQLYLDNENELQTQDQLIDNLHNSVSRQHSMGLTINEELDHHMILLNDLETEKR